MRHGYGTYRHQIVKNLGAVADEMGNSMPICRSHYLNAFCDETEAREWFRIMPPGIANIIPVPQLEQVLATGMKVDGV